MGSKTLSEKRKRVIKELVQGQESMNQLKVLLQKPAFGTDGFFSAEELVAKVLRSFTESLSVLSNSEAGGEAVGVRNTAISGENGSPVAASCNDIGTEDSGESRKRSPPAPKDRRGCYKRRRTSETSIIVSSKTEDGYAWRKYGQKKILNSKYPRSYFRCTRKYDEGCRAIKQVQRTKENPEIYQTTYIGHHTCRHNLRAPQMVPDLESFPVKQPAADSKVPPNHHEQAINHPSSSSTPTVKQEHFKEETTCDVADNLENNSLWSELKDFEMMPPKVASDNADTVYSCTGSGYGFCARRLRVIGESGDIVSQKVEKGRRDKSKFKIYIGGKFNGGRKKRATAPANEQNGSF